MSFICAECGRVVQAHYLPGLCHACHNDQKTADAADSLAPDPADIPIEPSKNLPDQPPEDLADLGDIAPCYREKPSAQE